MSERMVISEDQVVELLAFLVTAARGLMYEPNNYGPMRLLDAAERLCLSSQGEASPEAQKLFTHIIERSPEVQGEINRPEQFANEIDALCRSVALYLVDSSSLEQAA